MMACCLGGSTVAPVISGIQRNTAAGICKFLQEHVTNFWNKFSVNSCMFDQGVVCISCQASDARFVKASVLMKRLFYPTETVLSKKIVRSRIVLSVKDSPGKPLRRRPHIWNSFFFPCPTKTLTTEANDSKTRFHLESHPSEDLWCAIMKEEQPTEGSLTVQK